MSKDVYSTGPIENTISIDEFAGPTVSQVVFVKALNNSNESVKIVIKAFELNGEKLQIGTKQILILQKKSSDFAIFDVSEAAEWEVQIKVKDDDEVLLSVWGKDANGNLVPEHRLVHQELVKLDD